ncbi:MAG: hypothetical protein HXX10_11360 [Rhodoplanes sp.]|uniref:hypothetical protein n=1 Tax=Rhodoplanes sp. TaxID=1968906 RepID=UPI0017F5AE1A|nr:hypothetical protein [Rhodoplanes sp.]NVO14625.1 hypothetical protein [Rhodoplanes sp.]
MQADAIAMVWGNIQPQSFARVIEKTCYTARTRCRSDSPLLGSYTHAMAFGRICDASGMSDTDFSRPGSQPPRSAMRDRAR